MGDALMVHISPEQWAEVLPPHRTAIVALPLGLGLPGVLPDLAAQLIRTLDRMGPVHWNTLTISVNSHMGYLVADALARTPAPTSNAHPTQP
jgi:hypothetical protein